MNRKRLLRILEKEINKLNLATKKLGFTTSIQRSLITEKNRNNIPELYFYKFVPGKKNRKNRNRRSRLRKTKGENR